MRVSKVGTVLINEDGSMELDGWELADTGDATMEQGMVFILYYCADRLSKAIRINNLQDEPPANKRAI